MLDRRAVCIQKAGTQPPLLLVPVADLRSLVESLDFHRRQAASGIIARVPLADANRVRTALVNVKRILERHDSAGEAIL